MNVLGYDLASPWITLPLPSTDIADHRRPNAGRSWLMNQIDPGSANPPAGDSYVVVDNLLDVQSLTPAEIAGASSIDVSSVSAVATAAQAVTQEGFGPSPLPSGATGILCDTAANIEGLTPDQITALPTIGISEIQSSDTSLSSTLAQASAAEGAGLSVVVPQGDNVTVAVPDQSKLFFDGTDATAMSNCGCQTARRKARTSSSASTALSATRSTPATLPHSAASLSCSTAMISTAMTDCGCPTAQRRALMK